MSSTSPHFSVGKYFCVNVPLQDGIDDNMYLTTFKTVVEDTVNAFQPSAIVLQCGADSLGCDRLGAFNLSIAAHGECVNFVRKYNVPLLVLGGGGYTIKNVSRCWTYETAVLVGATIPNELPSTVFDAFFEDSHWKLHPQLTGQVPNQNTPASLRRITMTIRNKLRYLQGAPSVAMQEIPPDLEGLQASEERTVEEKEEESGTANAGEKREDRSMARNEFYDGEHDVDAEPVVVAAATPATTARRARASNTATTSRPTRAGRRGGRGTRARGRGRGGRARGRGGRAGAAEKEKEKDGGSGANSAAEEEAEDSSIEVDVDAAPS